MDGRTERLFGPDDCACVTVIVLVEVLTETGVELGVALATGVGIEDEVVESGAADMILLLIDIAGLDENR